MEMDDSWGLFLNTVIEQLRAKMKKNAIQIVEPNRAIAAEELMKIGPDLIREFAQMTIVEDYRQTLFDDHLVRLRPRPASLDEMMLADCLFDAVSEESLK
jgi:hypothetical protein